MIVSARGRRGLGRLAAALTAGVLAVGVVGLAATSGAAATTVAAGAAGTPAALAGVPWSKVGPGWELAEYTWAAHATVPYLIAWSGDKTRALLGLTGSKCEQLTLATGKLTAGQLPGRAQPAGYTRPDGLNILGITEGSSGTAPSTVARYSLAGQQLKVLTGGVNESTAVCAANGTVLAVSGSKGLELVSDVGGVIRSLPVPTSTLGSAAPQRGRA